MVSKNNLKSSHRLNKVILGDAASLQKQLIAAIEDIENSDDGNINTQIAIKAIFAVLSEDIRDSQKLVALRDIYTAAVNAVEIVATTGMTKAPILWKERPTSRMSPCAFVVEHYPNYGKGLCQADIARLDISLYRALHNWQQRYGWPEKFKLPKLSNRINAVFADLGQANPRPDFYSQSPALAQTGLQVSNAIQRKNKPA